jgi:hypothetical protein
MPVAVPMTPAPRHLDQRHAVRAVAEELPLLARDRPVDDRPVVDVVAAAGQRRGTAPGRNVLAGEEEGPVTELEGPARPATGLGRQRRRDVGGGHPRRIGQARRGHAAEAVDDAAARGQRGVGEGKARQRGRQRQHRHTGRQLQGTAA